VAGEKGAGDNGGDKVQVEVEVVDAPRQTLGSPHTIAPNPTKIPSIAPPSPPTPTEEAPAPLRHVDSSLLDSPELSPRLEMDVSPPLDFATALSFAQSGKDGGRGVVGGVEPGDDVGTEDKGEMREPIGDKTQPNVGDDKADKTTENTVAETTQAVAVVETVAETALAETPSGLGQASDLPPESSVQVVAGSSDVVAAPVESNTAESNPTAANTATEPAANEPQPVANVATEAAATTVHEAAGGETGEAGAGGVVPHPPEAHNERPAVPPMKLDLVRRRRRHSSSSSNTGPTVPAPT